MESTSDSLNPLLITSPLDTKIKNDDLVDGPPSRSVSSVPDDERNIRKEDFSSSVMDKNSTSSDIYDQNKNSPTTKGIIHEQSYYNNEGNENTTRVMEELDYIDTKLELKLTGINAKILKKKNKILNKQLDPSFNGEKERVIVAIQSNKNKRGETKEIFKRKRREKISRFLHLTKTN
ncbi:hypothetical protein EHI8A_017850 [Entamoeba histolytica HM-1:IMSS-B]|uniref:Uncharacterized protein n=6 Tax=Entamoeba histolytica TaxID=5759 RepID=B1N2U1_ENTH1|nr:hypothetical protein EHI_127080 [Entamoeba histolytica HM-1:IMSS]EMD45416.1 Hypothetical protein EHI5A_031480 [Entamoeba histolytica KU27]EMH73068.1 hypothetical protein EHI8A_017850 [Entamoeba histolytica HM-1:IMSS-B]EMS11607.1 hypothetical protein KM1_040070 [Entamoeba histolytica HM-3:IMSS]ENY60058.1 hypothetical protein EHI7A_049100 [Entamoeba histolytica HM-1:IMSS-A]GAT93229.1 hypothetical protein CL6EHI_127080 [Entamoeba histolytica]|eukprot:XP_001913507.1 hypothetical protein EHI_127080 [Entamoeba histolytica HM-1:IMSS]